MPDGRRRVSLEWGLINVPNPLSHERANLSRPIGARVNSSLLLDRVSEAPQCVVRLIAWGCDYWLRVTGCFVFALALLVHDHTPASAVAPWQNS